jgi:LysM domain
LTGGPGRRRRRRAGDVAAGAAAGMVVFAAVPAVLGALVGSPVPHHWDRDQLVSVGGLFDFLALVAWLAWAVCSWSLLRSVVSRVRRRNADVGGEARFADWLAARIAAAVLTVAPVHFVAGTPAGASPPRPPAAQVATTAPAPTSAVPALVAAPPAATASTVAETPAPKTSPGSSVPDAVPSTYTVQPEDSLWTIAERFYGDGADWATIAQANLGDLMIGGGRFTDPSLIVAGWVLSLPDPSGELPEDTTAAEPSPVGNAGPAPVPAPDSARLGERSAAASAPAGSGARGSRVAREATHHPKQGRRRGPTAPAAPLPELVALGLGSLTAAALARRARRRRQLASLSRGEGRSSPAVSELAADSASLLAPFDGAPLLDVLESANRHLSAVLADLRGTVDIPEARLVKVGPDGIDVRLAGPVDWAPPGWQPRHGAWRLPAGTDPVLLAAASAGHDPWLPVLVPVGENEDGTWLIPMAPGSCLPVLGSAAGPLVTAMRLAVESWSWSESLVSSDNVTAVEHATSHDSSTSAGGSPTAGAGRSAAGHQPVLYVGDPSVLSPPARGRCAVLTTRPALATDLTVVVDNEAASIHPLGVTVRPQLLDESRCRAIEELVATVGSGIEEPAAGRWVADQPVGRAGHRPTAPSSNGTAPAEVPAFSDELLPGQVEVRLLTSFPRMDGLIEELPPKRSRRATELVAYLAVHHPEPVTSDRLRTRVLGSATTDAAAKTLFNTVGAARRAMGRDMFGDPLLPPAAKSGRYCVSSLVSVDAVRAGALIAAAASAKEDTEEMALLRAGLELVEGEPMAGALTGYAWWSAEGHERRVAGILVDGACRLARLAVEHGHLELARWGIDRARLADPFSEVLSRAAMRLAAETGDADRLRREWAECQRRVDELEPGGLPSEATERLYVDLRRRLTLRSDDVLPAAPEDPAELGDRP